MLEKKQENSVVYEKENMIMQLTDSGVHFQDAEVVADCFATADLYGVSTHGKSTLPAHISRIKRGGYNLSPRFHVLRETGAFAVIDGDNAMGPVAGAFCMNYAVEKCAEQGMYTVFSRNNNTFGPAFYYPLLAAEKGYIGIAFSNSPAQMAPPGGREKLLGTNPFAIVIPVENEPPIILDMATSVVAKSKFKEYKEQGKQLPEGWALDEKGYPTTNPDEAIRGFVLPMAGYKGYGIAMMLDVMAGVLSGAAFLNKVGRFYTEDSNSMNVGFCFTAIDPEQVLGDDYNSTIKEFVNIIRNSEALEGCTISLPGEDRIQYAMNSSKNNEV